MGIKSKPLQNEFKRKIRLDRAEWGKIITNRGLTKKKRVRTKVKEKL